ncbi:MAG: hypothetical protein QXK06_03245 [Candidatus Diapherotrites archaeon]
MRLTKWHAVEFGVLALFALSLFLLYWILVEANTGTNFAETAFKPSTLSGALQIALSNQGKVVKTRDFNFVGFGSITSAIVLKDKNFSISQGQFCLALGEAGKDNGLTGGAENENESSISYRVVSSGPYFFSVFCHSASGFLEKARELQNNHFKPSYFSKCSCLKEQGKTCCVAILGKSNS